MRVLISGSTGLIGGNVCQVLSQGHDVLKVGRRDTSDIQVDFSDAGSLARCQLPLADVFIHCAGVVDEDFKEDPEKAKFQSRDGLAQFMDKVLACGVKTFIYFSTAHVYGKLEGTISEEAPATPVSEYGRGHYASEQIFKKCAESLGTKVLIFRPLAVYGMPVLMETFDRWFLIPYSFPLEAIYNQAIILKSSGVQKRNFVGTRDLANCVKVFLDKREEFGPYTLINPVGKDNISVYDFALKCANICQEVTGKECQVRRPQGSGGQEASDFILATKAECCRTDQELDDYLKEMMTKLNYDLRKDIRYGSK